MPPSMWITTPTMEAVRRDLAPVTAKAAGFALDFGHALVASILGNDKADDTVDRARNGYRA